MLPGKHYARSKHIRVLGTLYLTESKERISSRRGSIIEASTALETSRCSLPPTPGTLIYSLPLPAANKHTHASLSPLPSLSGCGYRSLYHLSHFSRQAYHCGMTDTFVEIDRYIGGASTHVNQRYPKLLLIFLQQSNRTQAAPAQGRSPSDLLCQHSCRYSVQM